MAPITGPDPMRGAADQRHRQHRDGIVEIEGRRRIGILQIHRRRRARRAHQRAGNHAGQHFQPQRRHAGAFGGEFVVPERLQAAADPGILDIARDRDRQHHEHAPERRTASAHSCGTAPSPAAAASGCRPRRRRYRQFVTDVSITIVSAIVAIEKKMPCMRRVNRPTAKPSNAPTSGGGGDLHGQRRAGRLEQEHGGIDADAEKRAGAEIHVAGIAAEDAPGHRRAR